MDYILPRHETDRVIRSRIIMLLLMLAPIAIMWGVGIVSWLGNPGGDFSTFWLAGHMVSAGVNPYAPDQWAALHRQYGFDWIANTIWLYPLPLAWFLVPLGLVPLGNAYIGWTLVIVICLILTIYNIMSARSNPRVIHYIFPIVAGILLFRPVILTLLNGQLGALLLLVLTLATCLWERDKWPAGGVLLAFVILKPSLGIPILGFSLLWLLRLRKVSAIGGISVALLSFFVFGWILDQGWVYKFLSMGSQKLTETFGYTPTIWGLANTVCHLNLACALTFGVTISALLTITVGCLLLILGDYLKPTLAISLIVPTVLLVTPYVWAYDQILLVLPFTVVTMEMMEHRYPYLVGALVLPIASVFSLVLLIFASAIGSDAWSTLVSALAFGLSLICILEAMKSRRARQALPGAI